MAQMKDYNFIANTGCPSEQIDEDVDYIETRQADCNRRPI